MTTFFFRRSVEKAFQLDESPSGLTLNHHKSLEGNPPYIISAVDDVMYIVNTVLQRSLSTSQRDVVASVVPTIGRVLGSDFVGMVQRKMRDESYPKPVIQGGFPPEDKIIAFIVLINSLDVANDYLARIISSRLAAPPPTNGHNSTPESATIAEMFPFSHDATFVINALNTLNTTFSHKTSDLITDGLHALSKEVIKPRLRPVMSDTFRDVDYKLTENDLDEIARANDTEMSENDFMDAVSRRFESAWDALMKPIGRLMTERSFAALLDETARYLAKQLEKRIWNFSGKANAMGGVRMERDFSGIVSVICRGGKYGLREVFGRVQQLLMVINMEDEEWEEIKAEGEDGGVKWVISPEERNRARVFVRD